jgi:hypothetical protein
MPRLELAKTGTWSGKKLTKSMLNDAAGNFSDRVPVIVGHESAFWSDASPAVGWIEGVEVVGSALVGEVTFTSDGLKLWDSKAYRNWSVGLRKDSEESPWELAHLALLGAANPAIKGLKVLEFSEGAPAFRAEFFNFSKETEIMDTEKLKEEMRVEFAAKEEAIKADFAAREAAKDAEIANLKAESEKARRAEFAARVEATFKAAETKVPAEKVKDLKALFSKDGVTVPELIEGLNAMFSGMPPMVAGGKMVQHGETSENGGARRPTKGV